MAEFHRWLFPSFQNFSPCDRLTISNIYILLVPVLYPFPLGIANPFHYQVLIWDAPLTFTDTLNPFPKLQIEWETGVHLLIEMTTLSLHF